jgi:L-amino acid N-acyltransferase YncA
MTVNDPVHLRRLLPADLPGILALQKANLKTTLDDLSQGFLSVEFTEQQFIEMDGNTAVVVALDGNEIVGYLCGTSWEHGRHFLVLRAMTDALRDVTFEDIPLTALNSCIYGPVCVAKAARGTGILEGLFGKFRELAAPRYAYCVLFIADKNNRSLRAHVRMGMTPVGTFIVNERLLYIFAASLRD